MADLLWGPPSTTGLPTAKNTLLAFWASLTVACGHNRFANSFAGVLHALIIDAATGGSFPKRPSDLAAGDSALRGHLPVIAYCWQSPWLLKLRG